MKHLVLAITLATLVKARPDLYREKEDFQFSRSSSDDGTKSGYYDAQRGNMGGNYERAHNMDTLAQHQMGGLITQVEGELGEGTRTNTGNVYSAANSRGVFGSGHYDLSKLRGRNFQESTSSSDSRLQSLSSQAFDSASHRNSMYTTRGHSGNSDYRGYQSNYQQGSQNLYDQYNQDLQRLDEFGNSHTSQNLYGSNDHNDQFKQDAQRQQTSRFYSQSGYQEQNMYHRSNTDNAANFNTGTHNRLITTVPVKIIFRPGQQIAVPLATQTHSGSHIASYYDQNSANTDAEVLNANLLQGNGQQNNKAKHYETSYSYRKEWEKHDSQPSADFVPTSSPIPKNSELYDESMQHSSSQLQNSKNEADTIFDSANSQSQHLTAAQNHQQSFSSGSSKFNEYNQLGSSSDLNSQSGSLIGTLNSKPKSYQSSYSYHKSWERQGDPYVIKPATNNLYDETSLGRLVDASNFQTGSSSFNYGSRHTKNQHYSSGKGCAVECEPGHVRVARSYNSESEPFGQHAQSTDDQYELGQAEYSGQQIQNNWDEFVQLGQQSYNKWDEGMGQFHQKEDNFVNLEQGSKAEKLETLDQHTQSNINNLEELGKQVQDTSGHFETVGQETQSNYDNLQVFDQQTQNRFDKLENLGQRTQNQFDNLENLGQHETQFNIEEQQIGQQESENKWITDEEGQESQRDINIFGQSQMDLDQKSQDLGYYNFGAQSNSNQMSDSDTRNNENGKPFEFGNNHNSIFQTDKTKNNLNQSMNDIESKGPVITINDTIKQTSSLGNLWNKLDNLDEDVLFQNNYNHKNQVDQSYDTFDLNKNEMNEENITTVLNYTNHSNNNIELGDNSEIISNVSNSLNILEHRNNETSNLSKNKMSGVEDIGRGDIGPVDIFNSKNDVNKSSNHDSNIYKNRDEAKETIASGITNTKHQFSDDTNISTISDKKPNNNHREETLKGIELQSNLEPKFNHKVHYIHYVHEEVPLEQLENSFNLNSYKYSGGVQQNFHQIDQHNQEVDEYPSQVNQENIGSLNSDQILEQQTNWKVEQQFTAQQYLEDFRAQNQETTFDTQANQEFIPNNFHIQNYEQQENQHILLTDSQQQLEDLKIDSFMPEIAQQTQERVPKSENIQTPEKHLELNNDYIVSKSDIEDSNKKETFVVPIQHANDNKTNIHNFEPIVPTTEKPSFWKSVGNKFVNAKNTVVSWFGS